MALADVGLRERVLVKDAMSSPVITIYEDETVDKAAQLMDKHRVGCVIVIDKGGKPSGIITERDLVVRVLAKDVLPSAVTAKDVMTAHLITIEPDATLSEAARKMSLFSVRRLGVMYKDELVGIITSRDVLAVMPGLIEIIQERARMEREGIVGIPRLPLMEGRCDYCGIWSDNLKEVEGRFLCEDCRIELGLER